MSEIVVKFSALAKASDDISKVVANLNSELEGLESGVQPLLSTWDGAARDAYHQRQQEWSAASKDLNQLLTQIKGAIDKSAEIMQAREQANQRKFG